MFNRIQILICRAIRGTQQPSPGSEAAGSGCGYAHPETLPSVAGEGFVHRRPRWAGRSRPRRIPPPLPRRAPQHLLLLRALARPQKGLSSANTGNANNSASNSAINRLTVYFMFPTPISIIITQLKACDQSSNLHRWPRARPILKIRASRASLSRRRPLFTA